MIWTDLKQRQRERIQQSITISANCVNDKVILIPTLSIGKTTSWLEGRLNCGEEDLSSELATYLIALPQFESRAFNGHSDRH